MWRPQALFGWSLLITGAAASMLVIMWLSLPHAYDFHSVTAIPIIALPAPVLVLLLGFNPKVNAWFSPSRPVRPVDASGTYL
jgi:hypothetical protein